MRLEAITFWVRIAGLFLLRSRRTTTILSLMVLLSVATLIFLSSMAVGINDAMVRNSVSLYSGHVSGFDLAEELEPASLQRKGVAAVVRRVESPGLLQRDNRFERITLVTSDPAEEIRSAALWRKIVAGRHPQAGKAEILLSRYLAQQLQVRPGDQLHFRQNLDSPPVTLLVSGLYHTGVEKLDRNLAFCPLPIITGVPAGWSAAIFLRDGADPEDIVVQYRKLLGESANFKTWHELMPDLRQLIDLNYVSMSIVIFIVFGLVALGVSSAFVIFMLKNLREYGIVKAMGVTPLEISFLIATEVGMMNFVASCGGVALGVVVTCLVSNTGIDLTAFTSHNRYFAVSGIVIPRLTVYSLWAPPVIAFCFALAASIWPAALVVRSKTADILRGG
jgi:ABC-type lipoprotein release transport system permease subunit